MFCYVIQSWKCDALRAQNGFCNHHHYLMALSVLGRVFFPNIKRIDKANNAFSMGNRPNNCERISFGFVFVLFWRTFSEHNIHRIYYWKFQVMYDICMYRKNVCVLIRCSVKQQWKWEIHLLCEWNHSGATFDAAMKRKNRTPLDKNEIRSQQKHLSTH